MYGSVCEKDAGSGSKYEIATNAFNSSLEASENLGALESKV